MKQVDEWEAWIAISNPDFINYIKQKTLDEVVEVLEGMVEHTKNKIQERGGSDWRRGKKAGLKRAISKIKEIDET